MSGAEYFFKMIFWSKMFDWVLCFVAVVAVVFAVVVIVVWFIKVGQIQNSANIFKIQIYSH